MIKYRPAKKTGKLSATMCHGMLTVFLLASLCLFHDDAQAREISRVHPLSAHIGDSYQCGETVEISVQAPSASHFSKGNRRFQQLINSVTLSLRFQCVKMKTLKISGMVGGSRVYEGHARKEKRWLIAQGPPKDPLAAYNNKPVHPGKKSRIGLPKVTQSQSPNHSKKIGPFSVWVQKVRVTPQGNTFMASVSLKQKLTIGLSNHNDDVCAQLMAVEIMVWPNVFNFDRFRQTHKGTDLPPVVLHALYLMRDLLSEQCSELKAIRFKFHSMNQRAKDLNYTGTMSVDTGWIIKDGAVRTNYDSARKIKLTFKDPYFVSGIDHQCSCEKNPTLPLIQVHKTNPFKAMPEELKVTITDYKAVAKFVAQKYLSECPGTETISFTINPVPEDYACRDKEPCYLTWSKQNPSEVTSPYKYHEKPMLNDYNDVMNAFIEGNYQLLDQYKGYIRFFHNDFLEVYSDFCSKYMTDRVTVDIKTIETRYDSDGFVESQKKVGQTYRVYIDPRYVNRFESFQVPNRAWAMNRLMRITMNKKSIMESTRSIQRGIGMFISDRNMIKNFLYDNKCKGKKTQTVYENLDRYFKRKPPIGLDGKIIESAMPAPKPSNAPQPPKVTQPTLSPVLITIAVGSWKAVIDGQPVELVLWQTQGNKKALVGYVYMAKRLPDAGDSS